MDKILLTKNLNWEQKKNAIEASLIMGFYSTSAEFPITSKEKGIRVPENLEDFQKLSEIISEKWPKDYISATEEAKPILGSDWRKAKGLESIFSKGIFLEDKNLDQLPDSLNFKISIPQDCNISILMAACNFAFRFGMETTAFEGTIIANDDWNGNVILFEENNQCGMKFIEETERTIIHIYGKDEEIEEFSSKICETFPLLPEGRQWVEQLQDMTDSLVMKNLDGQLSYLKSYKEELEGPITAYMSPEISKRTEEIQSNFPNIELKNYKSFKKVYENTYDIPWEVNVFKNILEEKVYNKLSPGDDVVIYGALSEGMDIRNQLSIEIKNKLEEIGTSLKEVQIVCAYKQGYSWIEEVILPKLKGQNVEKIEIAFKPFLPEGENEWLDEDGALPSYHNIGEDNPDKWFDLPIRYLQELYPIDDLIAKKLQISKEMIKFIPYKGEEDITYELKAFGDTEIFNAKYKAAYSERPYLDEYPKMGKVHPSTGFIKVILNGNEIVAQYIKTDLENIWDIYQGKVLPECKRFIETRTKGNINIDSQPFFAQLHLEVNASEPERTLPFRQDMISSLNSLHEDMYFVGTDYFKTYGIENYDVLIDAPGLIMPDLKETTGKPRFKVTLYDQLMEIPCIIGQNKSIENQLNRRELELYISEIKYIDDKITIVLNTNIKDEKLVKCYMNLLDEGILEISEKFSGVDILKINTEINSYTAKIGEYEELKKELNISDINLLEDSLIGYEEYIEIINQLKYVPGIDVYKIATSYSGRDIYAIEILPKDKGYISKIKRITNFPSEIINSRHHANEVSSTNAAFILLKKLLTEEKYKNLADKINLVMVPMENVDGSAIHYELQKNNPNWKLHVSRFNAIGKEFYYEHFNPDTIHTEAIALTRLWEKYLPDIIVDNHGVPSHEWEQQFSGYTSPSYKGFWLPRSLLYGYFWVVNNDEYKYNYNVNKKIEEVIANKIAEDKEITDWNKEWIQVFEKYAHGWMPKLFPADYYKNMINYWIPFKFDSVHRYPSIRFPWITTVSYTSEVADETAQGQYLNLCARTHVAHMEAVIKMLVNSTCLFESEHKITEGEISIKHIRHRPIIV